MEKEVLHHYGSEFNTRSAEIILPYLKEIYNFQSVIDVGCGIGTWLSVSKSLGVIDLLGIDGPHVSDLNQFLLPESFFLEHNFEDNVNKLELGRKFDLAICLEVAEHLKPGNAANFVKLLSSCSDVILFSAAVPGQTGENHFNEQFPSYWSELFSAQDFVFFDPFREKFWKNEAVDWWYRQNLFLVVNRRRLHDFNGVKEWDGNVYIIPDLLKMYLDTFNSVNAANLSVPSTDNGGILNRISSKLKRVGL